MTENRRRRLPAVLRNALTWGLAWALAGGGIAAVLTLIRPGPGVESLVERLGVAGLAGAVWGVRFGLAGAVIGTAFSGIVRLGYRGRRLADISPLRFTLLGALAGGVGVPLFLQTMNVLSGDGPVAWSLVTDDAVWATVFGAAVAGGSILLARRAEALRPGAPHEQIEAGEDQSGLNAAAPKPSSVAARRSRGRP